MVEGPGGDFGEIDAFARAMADRVESYRDHPEVYDQRTAVLQMARRLAADAHREVSYGMFAESSAGKSLLVGMLLGNPLLLPVAERTTTCNITVLRLVPAEVRTARVAGARAEYLTGPDLDAYAAHLRDVAAAQVDAADGDPSAIRALPPTWSALAELRTILDTAPLRLPSNQLTDLQLEVREMLQAHAALHAAGLAPGDVEDLTETQLREVVDHGDPTRPGTSPSPLAARRSMVRRAVAEVEVPATVWGPALLLGARIRLVDVPGSHSGVRPIRDDHLRVRELDDVDVTLFFLQSRPGSLKDSQALQDLMETGRRSAAEIRDGVLVVAGQFDTLRQTPDNLLAPPPVPPEEDAVLERSDTLRALVTAARALLPPGRDDRIFFVSPIVTIVQADDLDVGWAADEVTVRLSAGQDVRDARRRVRDWQQVGRIPGRLGDALAAFAVDGGLARLRAAMARHAREHGVDLLLRRLRGEAEQLRAAVERLERRRAQFPPVEDVDDEVRILFDQVLATVAQQLTDVRGAVSVEIGDPEAAAPLGVATAALVRSDVERLVYDWPEWKLLFDAVRDGIVVAPTERQGGYQSRFARLGRRAEVPVQVADFVDRFLETCDTVCRGLLDRVIDRVDDHLHSRGLIGAAERVAVVSVLDDPAVRAAVEGDPDGDALLTALGAVLDPAELVSSVRTELTEHPPEPPSAAPRFPLDPTRALPWHPEGPRRTRPLVTGVPAVLRLRKEFTAAVASHALHVLALAHAQAAEVLRADLAWLQSYLVGVHNDSGRWVRLVTEARPRPDSTSDPETDR
jgi:hypothetical protein